MSAEATAFVWRCSPYTGTAFTIHLAIADVVNDAHGNEFWMRSKALADKARTTRATASKILATLCDEGYLIRLDPPGPAGAPVRYRFEIPEDVPRWEGVSTEHTRVSPTDTGGVSRAHTPTTRGNSKELKDHATEVAREACPKLGRVLVDEFVELIQTMGVLRYAPTAAWYDSMRLMLVKDRRSVAEIRRVMRFATSDEFWRANVLSIPTVREKFDNLRLASERTGRRASNMDADEIAAELRRRREDPDA